MPPACFLNAPTPRFFMYYPCCEEISQEQLYHIFEILSIAI